LDHVVPLHLGGEVTDSNTQALCKACHADKTAAEATARAKVMHDAR
jgi:5-methylcytosine-specific restriction endonuclease McrA